MTAANSIIGRAIFISLSTPESEVKVELPVKFIVQNAETDGRSRMYAAAFNQPKVGTPGKPLRNIRPIAQSSPSTPPLKANALPGIHGSRAGARTVPINTAPSDAYNSVIP